MPNYVTLAEGSDLLRAAKRVMVIGNSGGGKTTLALQIAARFDLEYLSMDRDVRWLPGWKVRERDEQRRIIRDLVSRDRWVMDGTGPSSFNVRVPRADLIIWLRVPRLQALTGLASRVARNLGRVRPAMADGCPEPIPDLAFLTFIWRFDQDTAPRILDQIKAFGADVPVVVLRSRREASALLRKSRS
ncbi:MAG: AAA family ATPase [Pseudomonadota bacterium]